MSRSSWLEIRLEADVPPTMLISSLMDNGWSANYDGSISYLPLGDNEMYNWTYIPFSSVTLNEVLTTIQQKEERNETIGLVLIWPQNGAGIDLHLRGQTLDISLAVNRKSIKAGSWEITDVTWYLERLIPPLEEKATIGAITFEERN